MLRRDAELFMSDPFSLQPPVIQNIIYVTSSHVVFGHIASVHRSSDKNEYECRNTRVEEVIQFNRSLNCVKALRLRYLSIEG